MENQSKHKKMEENKQPSLDSWDDFAGECMKSENKKYFGKTLNDLDLVDHKDKKGLSEIFVRLDEVKQEISNWVKFAEKKLETETDQEAIWFVKGGTSVLKRFGNLE